MVKSFIENSLKDNSSMYFAIFVILVIIYFVFFREGFANNPLIRLKRMKEPFKFNLNAIRFPKGRGWKQTLPYTKK